MSFDPKSNLRVNIPLTMMSIGYQNPNYIADQQFPIVFPKNRSDIVPKFDQSPWFRNAAKRRAPGTASKGFGFTTDVSDTYYCYRHSFRFEFDDDNAANAGEPFDLDQAGTNFATDKLQLRREVDFATDFHKAGVWGTDTTLSGTSQWSDYANSAPLVDFENMKDNIEGKVGREPNQATMGKLVWSKLKWHPDVIDTIKHTQRAQMTTEIFAALVELERIFVGRGIQTTDPHGTAEASVTYTRIWLKHVLMLFVPPAPALFTPSAGYTFVWPRVARAPQYMKRMRNEEREVTIIEGNSYFAQKATAVNSGGVLVDSVA